MSPAAKDRPRRGGRGQGAPTNRTADRLDSVLVGQLVHLDVPSLTGGVPDEGWLTVASVLQSGEMVTLGFGGSVEPFTAHASRLVRVGW